MTGESTVAAFKRDSKRHSRVAIAGGEYDATESVDVRERCRAPGSVMDPPRGGENRVSTEVSLGTDASSRMTTGSGLHVTAWSPAAEARHLDEGAEAAGAELVWCDLRHATAGDGLEASLLALCPGLTAAMLADLLTPDRLPEGRSYGDGSIRLASTCALHFESSREESTAAGNAIVIQPVELLASHEWLITNWHPARRISSAGETTDVGPGRRSRAMLSSRCPALALGMRHNRGRSGLALDARVGPDIRANPARYQFRARRLGAASL